MYMQPTLYFANLRYVILFLICFPLSFLHAQPESNPLTISFILPLSGEWAFLGEGIRNGAMLAQSDINSENLNLIFEDNRGSLSESAVIAHRLVSSEKTDAVITIISGVAQVVKPILARAKIIQIGICSDGDVPDGKYNFINYLTAQEGVDAYISEFKKRYGPSSTVGIYSQNEAGFERISKELEKRAKEGDIKIAFLERYNGEESDFKPMLIRHIKSPPDVLMVSPGIEILAKQLKVYSTQTPLSSIESFGLAKDQTIFKGAWYVDAGKVSRKFQDKYKTFSKLEITPRVSYAYDSVFILYRAYLKALVARNNSISQNREEFSRQVQATKAFTGESGNVYLDSLGVFHSEGRVRVVGE